MIEIEIDGQTLQAPEGSMIIEAADKAGIAIPRFCYHKKLSIAANCRMCLVEVEKVGKPLPACATPITPHMKVFTRSEKAIDAQKSVMEFLLINHPLDCPICDQGGQCELQDVAMGYGPDVSRYNQGKRAVDDEDLGPLVATDMTRCIHCTRCVRFGEEIAGVRELGATGRGEHMRIGTYIKHSLKSELSGNIIDVCPVGALTSKPFRFKARAWELEQHATLAPHDCVGSNIYAHTWHGRVLRVVPRENESINEVWLSDRDRFSYAGLDSPARLTQPLIKRDGAWQNVDWAEALNYVTERLQKIKLHHGANQVGALIAPSATLEEHYLLQKFLRAWGCDNIDHRLRQTDFTNQEAAPLYPTLGCAIEELEHLASVFLIGSDVQRDQPIAGHRLRKASLKGAKIHCLNPIAFDFNFHVQNNLVAHPLQLVKCLGGVLKTLLKSQPVPKALESFLSGITPTAREQALAADLLIPSEKKAIILGAIAQQHPQASQLYSLANHIAQLTYATCGWLTDGANSAGAWVAGSVPHRTTAGQAVATAGLNTATMLAAELKAYILVNVEPELDCANPAQAIEALKQADFVVSLSPFKGGVLEAQADVILPIAPYTENSGTYINVAGTWQNFQAVTTPLAEVRPAWKVLRVMANLLEVPGFDYLNAEQIAVEVRNLCQTKLFTAAASSVNFSKVNQAVPALTRITQWPLYRVDNLVRRAEPLQQSAANEPPHCCVNAEVARELHVQAGEKVQVIQNAHSVELPVKIDERIPNACALVAAGFSKTAKLGESFGHLEIKKVSA